jgi:hypothetical protein
MVELPRGHNGRAFLLITNVDVSFTLASF